MGSGQLPLDLFFEPLLGLVVLAAGTVAVATAAKLGVGMTALRAVIDDRALGFGATLAQGVDHPALRRASCRRNAQDSGAIAAEKLVENAHLTGPLSRR